MTVLAAVLAAGALTAAMDVKATAAAQHAATTTAPTSAPTRSTTSIPPPSTTPLVRPTTSTASAPTAAPSTQAVDPVPTTVPAAAASAVPAQPVTNTCAVTASLTAAVNLASGRGEQAGAAVLDTVTGAYAAAGAADTGFATASVVKVLISAQLLLQGQMTGDTADTAEQMMVHSDDADADALYGQAGGDGIVTNIAAHYGITNLGSPPADTGEWGETMVTAGGLAHLYAALKADPVVWPWLSNAMAATVQTAADGTNQFFGIPAATTGWAIKQGWMVGLGPGATYNTTGYVDGYRYVVVILTHGPSVDYDSVLPLTISAMARAVVPPGGVGAATASCPG